jgi:prepilin-type N-terminal cleavage/methylation domain-containing protein
MKKYGFTLIELMVAIVVLAVLVAIAIPQFIPLQKRARESEVKSVTHALQMAVEDYKVTPGQEGLKPNGAQLITVVIPSYLPFNVLTKRNPFNMAGQTYGTGGIVAAAPGAIGEVGYQFVDQVTQYTISAWGGDAGVTILTLVEGQ